MQSIQEVLAGGLDDTVLDNVANIDGIKDQYGVTFKFIRRRAIPAGVLCHAGFVFKVYHMIRDDMPLEPGAAENLDYFLRGEIDAGNIDRKQGIGFAILGQGFLSISIWGKGNGLYVQTYSVEGSHPVLSRKTLEHTAVACTWDSRIMYHEVLAWHDYLNTSMSKADKLAYISKFISGYLDQVAEK
jgi:hypothetical protein